MSVSIPPLPSATDFRGRVAVVTGGTNGLGRHLAQTLIDLGAHVFFCGRQRDTGAALAADWGEHAHFVACDLADAAATRAFIAGAGAWCGSIDYLVNNAAIDPVVSFEASTLADFDRIIAINLRAGFVATQAALPFLRAGRGKAIVNLGTTNWMLGQPNYTMYAAAKSGLVGFTRSLAHDVGADAIRVNLVSPGWIMTERQLAEKVTPVEQAQLRSQSALGQLLTAQHVTPATLFLLSTAAAGITGQNLVVDGGKHLH
ncbi:SDR family NAD(P)-dependent oxidoreductase [Synoicihabitans lomoniglobus]|uniref:SDR family oxidoreductase n=1 Tax=Synoicihabitans lomoniglobus TaxID=2909285 RepID=A0AAE9ZUA4_9BACT|nr:SDR family oxidoreductase [Opitutaceae bacterium LMO-M01]WED63164.1 SDR family oxidoreductase [Opitutaceae bacterium LMO-M01]